MAEPTHNTHHAEEISQLLIGHFQEDPAMVALATIFGNKVQEIEDALWQLYTERGIDTAVGAQLDIIGKILGYTRGGLDDDTYRLRLRAKIALNKDSGTAAEILNIFALLLPGLGLELRDTPPAGFELRIVGVVPGSISINELVNILKAARAAGVEAQLFYSASPDASLFRYDLGPGYDVGIYAGSIIS